MSRKNHGQQAENSQPEGGDIPAEQDVHSTEYDTAAEGAAEDAAEGEAPGEVQETMKPAVLGIGQFVRHLLKNSKKTNAEILELVLKTFEGSKTTPACIAWYKTDMRKKGLLDGLNQRGKNKVVEFTAEQLAELTK
jgi:hypothetical protein